MYTSKQVMHTVKFVEYQVTHISASALHRYIFHYVIQFELEAKTEGEG
jgi:hypothetical protein